MGGDVTANFGFFGTDSPVSAYPIMQLATQPETTRDYRDSESAIIKSHIRRIRWRAVKYANNGISFDDLVQEGCIALLAAARNFDPARGVKLWTYARGSVFKAIRSFQEGENREQTHTPLMKDYSKDKDAEDGAKVPVAQGVEHDGEIVDCFIPGLLSPEDARSTREQTAILSRELVNLSTQERQVVRMRFVDELDVRSIADVLETSKSDVDRIFQGAIGKLRERVGAQL